VNSFASSLPAITDFDFISIFYCREEVNQLKSQGNEHYKSGSYSQAIRFYSDALKKDPSNVPIYSNRAAAYMMQKDYKRAVEDCETALNLDPKFIKVLERAARCSLIMGCVRGTYWVPSLLYCVTIKFSCPTFFFGGISKLVIFINLFGTYEFRIHNLL
jgi:tetratricopeptide (TPR) repeat protein